MTQELIYTSAPRGLRSGVKGFCTVASTAGMAVTLADRLESLSGYRHLFPPHDERASQNPVNYSHLKIVVGGQSFDVLSRVCDAGIDYSQRSNKLAHHVALTAAERSACGPARLLAEPNFMETSWQGEPRILPSGRKPPALTESPRICTAWQRATGDAGWAGVLAATAGDRDAKPTHVIIPLGLNALPLVAEALALVAPEHRWDVTFSTFFTRLPPGVDCQWRFVVDGQPEAETARRSPHWLVFDLCKQMPPAPDRPLVTAALTGKLPQVEPVRHPRATMVIADLKDAADAPPSEAVESAGDIRVSALQPTIRDSANDDRNSENPSTRTPLVPHRERRGVPKAVLYASAIACVVLVMASLAFVAYVLGSRSHREISAAPVHDGKSSTSTRKTEVSEVEPAQATQEAPTRETSQVASASNVSESPLKPNEEPSPQIAIGGAPNMSQASPVVSADVNPAYQQFAFVGLHEGRTAKAMLRFDGTSESMELVRWKNNRGDAVRIEIEDTESAHGSLTLENVARDWVIKTNMGITPLTIAHLQQNDNTLVLNFDAKRPEDQARLLGHVLRVFVGEEDCLVTFDFPRHESVIAFSVEDCQKRRSKAFEPGWRYLPLGYHVVQTVESASNDLALDASRGTTHSGWVKGFQIELVFAAAEKSDGAKVAALTIKPDVKILLFPHKTNSAFQPLTKASVTSALNQSKSSLSQLKKDSLSSAEANVQSRIAEETKLQAQLTELNRWLDEQDQQPIIRLVGHIQKDRP